MSNLSAPARIAADRAAMPGSATILRRCNCGSHTHGSGACADCRKKEVQRKGTAGRTLDTDSEGVPAIVNDVLADGGEPLPETTRAFMEPKFGCDFSRVRVHTGDRADQSAQAIHASAYAFGSHITFASGAYAPDSPQGRHLLAHELAHVVQQSASSSSQAERIAPQTSDAERAADVAADTVVSGGDGASAGGPSSGGVQRQAAPFIKQVKVHLTPPQNAELEWNGTAPTGAPGSDSFTVSTGKGYGDPTDPPKTCKRSCCTDAKTQCAAPWSSPSSVGACCTYVGTGFYTGTPLPEHNGWKYWTPIQPHYSNRFIALHQHDEVTGQPISHGCVRMEEANAERIATFSRGRKTAVSIDGNASPVGCDAARQCPGTGGGSGSGAGGKGASVDDEAGATRLADAGEAAGPMLEGELS